jgi:hypothetical protein
MVVAGRNPAGVLSGQRLPCHSPFSFPAFPPLTTRLFVPNQISASISAQHKYTIERLYRLRLMYYLVYIDKVRL